MPLMPRLCGMDVCGTLGRCSRYRAASAGRRSHVEASLCRRRTCVRTSRRKAACLVVGGPAGTTLWGGSCVGGTCAGGRRVPGLVVWNFAVIVVLGTLSAGVEGGSGRRWPRWPGCCEAVCYVWSDDFGAYRGYVRLHAATHRRRIPENCHSISPKRRLYGRSDACPGRVPWLPLGSPAPQTPVSRPVAENNRAAPVVSGTEVARVEGVRPATHHRNGNSGSGSGSEPRGLPAASPHRGPGGWVAMRAMRHLPRGGTRTRTAAAPRRVATVVCRHRPTRSGARTTRLAPLPSARRLHPYGDPLRVRRAPAPRAARPPLRRFSAACTCGPTPLRRPDW